MTRRPLLVIVSSAILAAPACSSSSSSNDGATTSGGQCSSSAEAGQVCNSIANTATAITPTCMQATMPTGVGGDIVDGTYVLTSQTYYNVTGCPTTSFSETITIAGGCIQVASSFGTTSSTVVTSMNEITFTRTCVQTEFDSASLSPDAPLMSFTASGTTFSLFTRNGPAGNPNPDRIEVFTKQ
jgi:hypothetical protein